MIDPITALATANAVFQGIKTAVNYGKEAQEVFSQLGKWASAVEDVKFCLTQEESKPSIFKKITYTKSSTAEAFDELAARQRIKEMEKELKHMFYWGSLHHLGADGYKQLIQIRRSIQRKREAQVYQQIRKRKELIYNSTMLSIIAVLLMAGWWMVQFLIDSIKGV
jgi:hypothetical protein|tara:strand:- start:62 stop:559 length:498 start_codon:yes stop_codon:yes gene_type:complete